MRYREATPQLDVFSLLSHEQAVTQVVKGINKLSKVIDWELFREELESVLGYIVDPEKVVFQLSDLG